MEHHGRGTIVTLTVNIRFSMSVSTFHNDMTTDQATEIHGDKILLHIRLSFYYGMTVMSGVPVDVEAPFQ